MRKERFTAEKRKYLDGRVWWCVYDNLLGKYSTYICHGGKYRTKRECQMQIDVCNKLYANMF